MANWADYFSNAFNQQNELAQKMAFEKWKTEQDQSSNNLQTLATMLGIRKNLSEMGMLQPDGGNISLGGFVGQPQSASAPLPTNLPSVNMGGDIPYIAKSINMFGVPTGYEPDPRAIKAGEKMAEKQMANQEQLSGTGRFLKQFGRSYEELKSAYPEIGDVGYTGWATRNWAKIATALDEHPETKAFQVELKPLANQMARDVEGGRVTDKDREVYADSFANVLKNPDKTNIRLVSNTLIKMKEKGGDISKVLKELNSSDVDIMQEIVKAVVKDAPELGKNLYNIPEGWEIVNE